MEAGYYAISAIGGSVAGVSGAREVTLTGIAKDDSKESYTVVNEYVCSRVAAAIGLPVPPGTIAQTTAGDRLFVSLRFSAGPTSLPPVNAADLAADHPLLTAGIVAFDCWVANWDRHAGNLAYVRAVSGVSIFDHGRTLLRMPAGAGAAALDICRDQPNVHDGHALLGHVASSGTLQEWADRIAAVPDGLIAEACGTAARLGACDGAEAQSVEKFLVTRKTCIMEYLRTEKGKFPHVSDWRTTP